MSIGSVRSGFFIFAISICFCAAASAGVIPATPLPVPSGPGLGFAQVAAIVTILPNNDNVPFPNVPDNNIVVPLKRFDSNNYIDIEFPVNPSGGVTEYQVSEFIDNNTGSPWGSYTMLLGFGTGNQFQLAPAVDGLDFDFPNYDTPPFSAAFSSVAKFPNELIFSGGTHGAGAQPYQFRIDVPDNTVLGPLTSFTLRQIPAAVPEPSSILLAALSFVGFALGRRRA